MIPCKGKNLLFPVFILLLLTAGGISSCKRYRAVVTKEELKIQTVHVILKGNLNSAYLTSTYGQKADLKSLVIVSRTENKWQFETDLADEKLNALLAEMQSDGNIQSAQKVISTPTVPNNSENSGHSKTKPIKSK